ncbi:MAG: glycosyltransferase family 4 protein [Flavobacteriaceae bacterium]|nr:glycosyltransferase family 4 protein [Flavobacteriaceae bacterium]
MIKPKLIRITTVPISLDKLLEGQLNYMSNSYEVIAVSADDNGKLESVARREGVRHHAVELTRAITPIQDLKALYQMVKFLKNEKPYIVHSHTPKAGTIGMWAAKIAGVPIRLHTVAGLPLMETTGNKRKLLNAVEKMTYAAATHVLPNSNGLKEIILNAGFTKANKLYVIGKGSSNGINTEYFDPTLFTQEEKTKLKAQLGIQNDDFVYIFVGRLVKDKGIEELVTAFSQLNEPQTKLLLVGPLEPELDPLSKETLNDIENNPNIITTGWQQDVRPYLAISNVLTFPSYREGFPNVVMQAGAMELPAIVSDINGCNEIIQEGENGLIIPVKNAIDLRLAMQNLYANRDLYTYMRRRCRNQIVQNYSRDFIWSEMQAFYKNLLNSTVTK